MRTIASCGAVMLLVAACTLEAMQETGKMDDIEISADTLKGKRLQFSWTSGERGGVNGIAWLKADGRIEGIGSPNETTWLVDGEGRLIFKHADGRVSTVYDKVQRVEGLLCFEGPFLFREGITHHLLELEGGSSGREYRISPKDAEKIKYSAQQFVYLDPGETCSFRLKDGREKKIRLLSVEDIEDPVIHLTRRAEVRVEIDGKPFDLVCAPYVMPLETDGLRIQADTTTGWLNMPKRVQLSLWDASDPIVDTSLFGFPLPGYRLLSLGMQAYNEPVHLGYQDGDPVGQRFHHNYGVDMAGYESRQKVVSCIDGVVILTNRGEGDLAIRDDQGVVFHYGHLDTILSGIEKGSRVRKGQWVGMLGRRGPSGEFAHLHVGVFLSELALSVNRSCCELNLYPWLVAAFQEETGTDLYAVARPHRTVLTGDRVLFDGSSSMAFGSKIISYQWAFHDGTVSEGPRAEKVFDRPGCYMASLRIEDDRGRRDVDFCKVKVFSRERPEDVVPILFATYLPSLDVRVNQPLYFRIWPQGLGAETVRVDFGDGTVIEDYRPYSAVFHAFKKPGIHIVTASGEAGGLPMSQKVKVVVGE